MQFRCFQAHCHKDFSRFNQALSRRGRAEEKDAVICQFETEGFRCLKQPRSPGDCLKLGGHHGPFVLLILPLETFYKALHRNGGPLYDFRPLPQGFHFILKIIVSHSGINVLQQNGPDSGWLQPVREDCVPQKQHSIVLGSGIVLPTLHCGHQHFLQSFRNVW